MSTQTLISVEEYLASSYEPDCDYIDGQREERNLGETSHAGLQLKIRAYLLVHYGGELPYAATELRIRIRPLRFRIPDVCAFLQVPTERVPSHPPFLCIEILSPDDRMSHVEARINDYLEMGVAYVWVLDPETRQAYVATAADGLREVKDGILRTRNPALQVPLSELFS